MPNQMPYEVQGRRLTAQCSTAIWQREGGHVDTHDEMRHRRIPVRQSMARCLGATWPHKGGHCGTRSEMRIFCTSVCQLTAQHSTAI